MLKTSRFQSNSTWCIFCQGLKTIWSNFQTAPSDSYFWKETEHNSRIKHLNFFFMHTPPPTKKKINKTLSWSNFKISLCKSFEIVSPIVQAEHYSIIYCNYFCKNALFFSRKGWGMYSAWKIWLTFFFFFFFFFLTLETGWLKLSNIYSLNECTLCRNRLISTGMCVYNFVFLNVILLLMQACCIFVWTCLCFCCKYCVCFVSKHYVNYINCYFQLI